MRFYIFYLIFLLFILQNSYTQEKDTITIIGVGDIMMGTNYPEHQQGQYLPANKGTSLFNHVTSIFQTGDIVLGNLEGCILNHGGRPKKCNNPNSCYFFRMPEYVVPALKNAGFDVLNLANNHANDFGSVGILNTHRILKMANIYTVGLKNICEYATFLKNGIRYGIVGVAPNVGAININDYKTIKQIVQYLDSVSDIVIVSFHGGAEGEKHNRVTLKYEFFFGENRGNVYELAHYCIDWGADVVFGHGPHVPRAIELYKDRIIAYSLGNFCTPFRMSLSGSARYAPIIKANVNKEGKFFSGEIISALQYKGIGPKIDTTHKAAKEIKRLTQLDFPKGNLFISIDGKITK
ncbi:MAG: CapA family protein [Chitinophagaceae bacterium]